MTPGTQRAARALAIIGTLAIWVPLAVFSCFFVLALGSSPGIGDHSDFVAMAVFGVGVVIGLPIATRAALRRGGVRSRMGLVVIGLGLPLLWAIILPAGVGPPPIFWMTCGIVSGGAMLALGGLLSGNAPARGDLPPPAPRRALRPCSGRGDRAEPPARPPQGPGTVAMTSSRLQSILVSAALALPLLGIAVLTFGSGAEDWRYQLAGLADPFLGRPAPGTSVIVGVVISAIIGAAAMVFRAIERRDGPSAEPTRGRVRWHWWWLLVAGWVGYFVGSAVVIAGGGPVDYRGSMRLEFGAPLGSVADVPATCRSVFGEPERLAQIIPAVDGIFQVDLRNIATGQAAGSTATLPVFVSLTNDGVPENDFEPPNVPDRPAPYIQVTYEDGSTQADSPISFLRAYDYRVLRLEERGLTGEADLLGVRFADPFGFADVRWMNLEFPRDPWHAAMDLTVSWSCVRSGGSTVAPSPVPSPPLPSPTQSVAPAASASAAPSSTVPRAVKARIRILTSSDWAVVRISGARFLQASRVDVQGETEAADFDGETFGLSQPGAAAEAGTTVSMTWDMIVEGVTSDSTLTVEIMPGAVGTTTVILYNAQGDQPVAVRAINWSGYTGKALREIARWPASVLLEPAP